jgi:hypothetical protein
LLSPAQASDIPSYVEGTDQASVVYNPLQVNSFQMQMSDHDLGMLTSDHVAWNNEGPWLRTTMSFTMAGTVYGPYTVGVHLKGAWGSWRDINGKAGFKIKMDAFVKDQTLFGITKFTLNNMVQDPSYIHEALTYRLFRALGVPTPRVGYANVTVNGRNYGLHLNVETVDTTMIQRWGLDNAHLYKGGVPNFPDFNVGYESYFAVEDGSTTSFTDLTNFMRINQKTGDAWWQDIKQNADIQEIMMDFATEAYVGHWDGYPFNHNNFFITFDSTGYAHMMPWGTDQTWGGGLDYFGSGTVLFQRCMSSNDCKEMYLQNLAKVVRTADSLKLPEMVGYVGAAIHDNIIADPWGPGIGTATDYQNWTIWNINNQKAVLSNMVQAWDTGIAKVAINGLEYPVGGTITLAPGSNLVEVKAIPYQIAAIGGISHSTTLKPGLNNLELSVISSDGQHTSRNPVAIYVLTDKSSSAQLNFVPRKSKLAALGLAKFAQLKGKLTKAVGLSLKISMAKAKATTSSAAKALLNVRSALIVKNLKLAGINAISITKTLLTSGNPDSLTVSVKYRD